MCRASDDSKHAKHGKVGVTEVLSLHGPSSGSCNTTQKRERELFHMYGAAASIEIEAPI